MSSLRILNSLYLKRFEHEDRARKRMLDSFENDVTKQQFQLGGLGKEHRIVLIGGSNVGKTTLILTLLGAKSTEEDDTNNILTLAKHVRGNTEEGGAGTSTVTRYRVSENDQGKLILPRTTDPILFTEIEELGSLLRDIRKSVEAGHWDSYDPISISLPKKFFRDQQETPWVITDLPGIGSTSTAEHNHVSDLMKAWVLQCNVFLVMTMANQINQLKTLEIPGIGSWKLFSRRCRVVITRSLTEHSMLEWLKPKEALTTQQLVQEYKDQLLSQGISLDYVNGVFPMDYGHSWENLKTNHPDIFKKVDVAMKGVSAALTESLLTSLSPEEEYRIYVDLGQAEELIQKKKDRYSEELKEVRSRISKHEEDKKATNAHIQFLEKRLQENLDEGNKILNQPIDDFPNPKDELFNMLNGHDPNHPDGHYSKWNDLARHFRKLLDNYSEHRFGTRQHLYDECRNRFGDVFPPFTKRNWRTYSNNSFNESYTHTFMGNMGFFKKPFGGNSKNERRDEAKRDHKNALRTGIEAEVSGALGQIWVTLSFIMETRLEELVSERKKLYANVDQLRVGFENTDKTIQELVGEEINLLRTISELENTFSADMKRFREQYPRIRKEELERSIAEYLELGNASDSAPDKIQYLSFANKIKQVTLSIGGF